MRSKLPCRVVRLSSVILASSLICVPARAQDPAADVRAERARLVSQFPEAFAPVTDDPAQLRVLLIGDSISIGYTPAVRELLKGIANVHRIPDNAGTTTRGVAMLDEWLGKAKWDLIHVNFGLHDIARDNKGASRTSQTDYETNLRTLVSRLQGTGARVIFATTTPVPDANVTPSRRNDDVLAYNQAARNVMQEFGVPVNDLYPVAFARLSELQQPANVHFTPDGYRALAERVAASIRAALPTK